MRDEAAAVGVADASRWGTSSSRRTSRSRALSDVAYVLETGRLVAGGDSNDLAKDDRVRHAYLGGHAGG
jgi:hypothetical protein